MFARQVYVFQVKIEHLGIFFSCGKSVIELKTDRIY